MPGFINNTFDLCEFLADLNNDKSSLLKTYLEMSTPDYKILYKEAMHPCPYKVSEHEIFKYFIKFIFVTLVNNVSVLSKTFHKYALLFAIFEIEVNDIIYH
jgi:hypothetical protein